MVGYDLASHWHASRPQEDQPPQGINFLVLFAGAQRPADGHLEVFQRRIGLNHIDPGALFFPQRAFILVVFILDLADDDLDQVLDRHKTINPAVFINDQSHMHPVALHLLQKRRGRHRGRHVKDRPQQLFQRKAPRGAKAMRQGQVFQQQKALWMVQCGFVNRHPAEAMASKNLDQFVLADVDWHRHDFDLGNCNIVDPQIAQIAKAQGRTRCPAANHQLVRIRLVPGLA